MLGLMLSAEQIFSSKGMIASDYESSTKKFRWNSCNYLLFRICRWKGRRAVNHY